MDYRATILAVVKNFVFGAVLALLLFLATDRTFKAMRGKTFKELDNKEKRWFFVLFVVVTLFLYFVFSEELLSLYAALMR